MALVKVWTDIGERKPVSLLAKIIKVEKGIYSIKYFTQGKDHVWKYEDEIYEIDEDSIDRKIYVTEEDLGYVPIAPGEFIRNDSDDDYEPPDEEDEEDEEEEDEEEDEEEFEDEEEEDEEENIDEE